jgi:ubiquinone/menaquinone biosynthesis C-methylase UbiE
MSASMKKPTTDLVRREYDRLAANYDRRWRPYIDATLQAVLESVSLDGREEVLDVACGTGELPRLLLERWPDLNITGADLSPGMLEQAKSKNLGTVTWLQRDAASLAVPDGRFDYVICTNSFHYFPHPREALQEMRRVLRPRGTLVLVDWCDDYLACKLCSLWLRYADPAFQRAYSLRGCREMLTAAGLETVAAQRFRAGWVWGLMRVVAQRADSAR